MRETSSVLGVCILSLCYQYLITSVVYEPLTNLPYFATQNALRTSSILDSQQPLQLQVQPTLIQDGEDVHVSWNPSYVTHEKDFIGLTCGPSQSENDFLRKTYVPNANESTNSIHFPRLVMMRCDYLISYNQYIIKAETYQTLDRITVRMKDSFSSPKHGHLALTSKRDEMMVMFNSDSNLIPNVRYGTEAYKLDQHASGTSQTYHARDMCHAPANIESQKFFRAPGFIHKVLLQGLHASTQYFYQYGNDQDGYSAVYSFQSRPDDSLRKVRFIAYADMGTYTQEFSSSATANRVANEVASNGYDHFLLHFGDISYARGQAYIWDEFFYLIEPIATRVPYMIGIGNHEYDYLGIGGSNDPSGAHRGENGGMNFQPKWGNFGEDSSGECSVPMFYRFHTPDNGHSMYWYSFKYGNVHIIQISSEHDWRRDSEQYKWIEEDLAAVDRRVTPWVVLTAHRMMYTSQLDEVADTIVAHHFRDEMEGLLFKYKVNLVLVGHQHSYERTCHVLNMTCVEQGTVHVVVGTAGAGLEPGGFLGNVSVRHTSQWGYLRLNTTDSKLTMEFVLNENGQVFDRAELGVWK